LKKTASIITLLLIALNTFAQPELNFIHIGTEDGLSQSYVTSIVQDSIGFLWFGTFDGLNKYDGYKFTTYYNNKNDTNSISNNQITTMAVDNNHQLWIGTNNGLNYYDNKANIFRHYNFKTPTSNTYYVDALMIDKEGLVWFSYSSDSYLNCYNPKLKKLNNIELKKVNSDFSRETTFLYNKMIISPSFIFESSDQNIWVGTNVGIIYVYNKEQSGFIKTFNINETSAITSFVEDFDRTIWASTLNRGFCHIDPDKGIISNLILRDLDLPHINEIFTMIKYIDGTIWIGMMGKGVCIFDKSRRKIKQYQISNEPINPYNPIGVRSFFIDRSGMLWCGTNGYGIFSFAPYMKKFNTIKQGNQVIRNDYQTQGIDINSIMINPPNMVNSLNFKSVRGIYADNEYIYAGGYIGFDKINRKTGVITNINKDLIPYNICPDPGNNDMLWIGTEGIGNVLYQYNKSNNTITCVEKVDIGYIFKLLFDNEGYLWIGSSSGLILYNPGNGTITQFNTDTSNSNGIKIGRITSLLQDHEGFLWIGSKFGWIARMDINKKKFEYFSDRNDFQNTLGKNSVLNFYEDKDFNLWIGTGGSGLYMVSRDRKKISQYTSNDGLPNNFIYDVINDDKGCLWLSTNKGISRFDPKNRVFTNFTKSDGLQDNEFNTGSYFKSKDGEIFFGGVDGITYFRPAEIDMNYYKPSIILTSVKVDNEELNFNKPSFELNEFVFSRNNLVITFEFTALSYYQSFKNRYECLLQGINNKWVFLGTENKVTFTGLEDGNYTLKIRASNNDGIWCENPLVINFRIPPPYWREWWVIACSSVLLAFIFFISLYLWLNTVKKRRLNLEEIINQRTWKINQQKEEINEQKLILEKTNVELKRLNDTKDKFFSIIGHDLRSPFNAILGFTELLEDEFDRFNELEKKRFISNIRTASNNAYKLLHNLLEWSSSQAGLKEFRPSVFDLTLSVNDSLNFIRSQSQQKKIRIKSTIPVNTLVYADQNMLSTVFRNLVSNAVKFTYEGGEILISTSGMMDIQSLHDENNIVVLVSDNGTGIYPEDFDKLFSIEKKTKREGTAKEQGTGLGLIICKEFIERNSGRIWAENNPGKGSTFYFTIPRGE
jgi:signal transduction histidine kinase/ligand-binding sensor domain-containing protein